MSDLLVRHGSSVVPFSRGILSRSLLELGIEPTRAHDIATAMHPEFVAEGMSLGTTQHLARIVGERLARQTDAEIAARYEKMRLFKRSDRPLVLLVGGSTGSGKSSLATEVAHQLDVTRILSTDSVRHVMRASYISVVSDRAQYWLGVGAQPSDAVAAILKITGDWQKFKGLPGEEGTLQVAAPKRDKIDVAELHAPFASQEIVLRRALGLADVTVVNPSGGPLAANPMMAAGLIRIGEAAERIRRGECDRALAHATSGHCLQQNLVCVLEGD